MHLPDSSLWRVVAANAEQDIPIPSVPNRVVIGLGRGSLECRDPARFDLLVTDVVDPPRPWVGLGNLDSALADLMRAIDANPVASTTMVQVLRTTEALDFESALAVESMAYSMLLGGCEFGRWRARTPRRQPKLSRRERVRIAFVGEVLQISLARPEARNAVDAEMRDQLVDRLTFAIAESGSRKIVLAGDGPDFCAGGDLDEFGTADDLALTHLIRMEQSPALPAHTLAPRLTARLHGACIGAGIEIPAAASRVLASRDAWFRLPEVGMGLIPGAGGTVTIPRRIGRHRTCYLALRGERVDAAQALQWGLIDEIHD